MTMIKIIIYDVTDGSMEAPLANLAFNEGVLPQKGDNVVINNIRYVVQRREYVLNDNNCDICLQVKQYIPDKFGY